MISIWLLLYWLIWNQRYAQKVLPGLIMRLEKRYLNHKHRLPALGNLHHLIKQLTILMMTIIFSVTLLVCFMSSYINDFRQLVIIVMSYVVLTILIAVSIVYKVLIEAAKRKKSFLHMKMLGYVTADLKKDHRRGTDRIV